MSGGVKRTNRPLAIGLLAAGVLVALVVARCEPKQLDIPTDAARTLDDNESHLRLVPTLGASSARGGARGATVPSFVDSALPEHEFLQQLRELNLTDKYAALTLAEKGDTWYSATGSKAEARRAMRITLLVDLVRMPEARALTREFIEQYPRSPYRKLVQGVTGIHPRPAGPRP